LKAAASLTTQELWEFETKMSHLAALISQLDALESSDAATRPAPDDQVQQLSTSNPMEAEPMDTKNQGWGPKTADPGPEKLREVIDLDPLLEAQQREALYKVVEQNQAAFGFDGRLGHLKSEVHIELMPGTKPILMPPYYGSPAKRDVIDKQIDLWLSQGVIEESRSPWGAPVIIIYRNNKPRVCNDFRWLNKATVAHQHPIPKQTDILQALSGTQYLSIFDALSGFTQLEFDETSQPISAIQTHRGLHHFKQMPFGW
jgi:hypothetical protein